MLTLRPGTASRLHHTTHNNHTGKSHSSHETLTQPWRHADDCNTVAARPPEVPDGHDDPSAVLVPTAPVFTNPERLALTGLLAGYSGLTREAYELDLRQFASCCQQHHFRLFQARRADIECFARDLEARGRVRVTITRRLCTVAGFYRFAVEEDLLDLPRRRMCADREWIMNPAR